MDAECTINRGGWFGKALGQRASAPAGHASASRRERHRIAGHGPPSWHTKT